VYISYYTRYVSIETRPFSDEATPDAAGLYIHLFKQFDV
jgi:hypothetical protein